MKKVLHRNLSVVVAASVAVAPAYAKPVSATLAQPRPVATAVPSPLVAASTSAVSFEAAKKEVVEEVATSGVDISLAASQRWPLRSITPRAVMVSKTSRSQKKPSVHVAAQVRPAVSPPADGFRVSRTASYAVGALSMPQASDLQTQPVVISSTRIVKREAASNASVAASPNVPVASSGAPSPASRVALLPPRSTDSRSEPKIVIAPKKVVTKVVTTSTVKTVTVAPRVKVARREPTILKSRSKDRLLLAQLEADLRRAQGRLNNASATLSQGQKQLLKVGNTLQQAMLEAGNDAKGLHPFVRVAQRYAGIPYVWGGESRNGFDCSGFIIVVMRDLGYRALPHSAAEQFNYGIPVAKSLIKPGDIVFFKNTYKRGVSHVGIYLGRGRFIHAAGTGIGTIVSSLNEPKWILHYAGARRLVRG